VTTLGQSLVFFGQNIYLLIGLLMLLAVVLMVFVVGWTAVGVCIWRVQQRRARRAWCGHDDAGAGRPAVSRRLSGVCARCGWPNRRLRRSVSGALVCTLCHQHLTGAGRRRTAAAGGHHRAKPAADERAPVT